MKKSSLLIASVTGLLLSVSVFASVAHAAPEGGTGTCTGEWSGRGRDNIARHGFGTCTGDAVCTGEIKDRIKQGKRPA